MLYYLYHYPKDIPMKRLLTLLTLTSMVLISTGCEQKKPKEKTMIIDTSKEKCSAGKCATGKCAGANKNTTPQKVPTP
jgi:hypothetical protein